MRLIFLVLLLVSLVANAGNTIDPEVKGKITFSEYPDKLGMAGRVIAHENGVFNFSPLTICNGQNTCPQQLVAMRKANIRKSLSKQLHFVKVSVRTLADGNWVVAHDQIQFILDAISAQNLSALKLGPGVSVQSQIPVGKKLIKFTREGGGVEYLIVDDNAMLQNLFKASPNLKDERGNDVLVTLEPTIPPNLALKKIDLSAINLEQYQKLKQIYGEKFDVYQLKDFTAEDQDKYFNYFLYFKTDPNEQIIKDIHCLSLDDRAVLESRTNNDAEWVFQHQGQGKVYFTGRVANEESLRDLLTRALAYGSLMWAIEIQSSASEATITTLTKKIRSTPYVSELDAMPFSPLDELFDTGCYKTLVDLGADISMTSRPANCLSMMAPKNLN